jgi:hypothetical protein
MSGEGTSEAVVECVQPRVQLLSRRVALSCTYRHDGHDAIGITIS